MVSVPQHQVLHSGRGPQGAVSKAPESELGKGTRSPALGDLAPWIPKLLLSRRASSSIPLSIGGCVCVCVSV